MPASFPAGGGDLTRWLNRSPAPSPGPAAGSHWGHISTVPPSGSSLLQLLRRALRCPGGVGLDLLY